MSDSLGRLAAKTAVVIVTAAAVIFVLWFLYGFFFG